MEEKHNEATLLRPRGNRTMDAVLVTIDLPSFIKQIRQESTWKESDRNSITVFKTNGLRIVVIALHKDVQMTRYITDGHISILVLKGKIQVQTDLQSVKLKSGQMLALDKYIPLRIDAKKESTLLLTLTTTLK